MKNLYFYSRYLLIGLCLLAGHSISFAQKSTGSLEKLIRFAQGTSLRADGDTGETKDSGFFFHEETGELELTADFMVDKTVPFNNPAIKRIYGDHTFFRTDNYDGTILEIGAGVDLTFEATIDGQNNVAKEADIIISEEGTLRYKGNMTKLNHTFNHSPAIRNGGNMIMDGGSITYPGNTALLFGQAIDNQGVLELKSGTISGGIVNGRQLIINENTASNMSLDYIRQERSTENNRSITIASKLQREYNIVRALASTSTAPGHPTTYFWAGEIIAQGTDSYQVTETDAEKLLVANTNLKKVVEDNKIVLRNQAAAFDLQAQINAATGTAENPTVITIPEAGLTLSEQITIKDKHVKITGGTITADFSKIEYPHFIILESGTLILENITLDGNKAAAEAADKKFCSFLQINGGVCYLKQGFVLQNVLSHWDFYNPLLINGGVCYMEKGAKIQFNKCLMGGTVAVYKEGRFVLQGGGIYANEDGNNGVTTDKNKLQMGSVYVAGTMEYESGEVSHDYVSLGVEGNLIYTPDSKNFQDAIKMLKGGTITLVSSLTHQVRILLDNNYREVEAGDVIVKGTSGYQLTESDRAKFQMPEGYSLKLEGNTLVLVKEGEEGVSTLDELIAAINAAPTGTNIATQINVNGTIYVDRMITIKGKHIYLTGKDLVFINTATTHIRFFSVENGGELHIANAVLDGNKDKTGKYCSFAYVSANSRLTLQGVTMKNAWSDSKTWTMLRIEGKCYIYTGNVNNTRKFSSIINNSGTGLVYIGTKGNCHFNEVKVENNVCAESGYVYSLITNEGSFMYEVGEFIQNHAIAITTTPTGTSQVVGSFHNYLDPADQSGGSAIFLYGTMHVFKYSHIQDAIYLEQSNNVRGRLLISNSLENQLTIVCQKPQEGWVVAQATNNYKLTQADLQKLVLSSALAKEYKLELVDNTIVLKALTGTQYNVTVEACKNGTLTADKKVAAKGEVVTITAKPAKGYKLYTEQLCYNRYYQLQQLTGQVNVFTFNMPSTHAHVEAEFIPEKVNIIYPDPEPFDPNKDILPGKGFGNLDSLINFVNTPDEIGQEAKPVPEDELPGDLRGEIDNAKEKGDKHYGSLEDLIAFVSGTQKTVLHSTPCKVRLTFYLPKSSLRASTNGSYYILCESEGKVTRINPEYDTENNALMFETDKLGIFAVMYGSSSTANDDITRSVHVWSEGNTLHVFTAEQTTVRIYTLGGQLYKTATGYGELQFTGIPNGNYIIEVKNRTFKIAL